MADRPRVRHKKTLIIQRLVGCFAAIAGRAGTVHAQPQPGTRQRQSLHTGWLIVLSTCLLTSCVVLPPTADPPADVPPLLNIAQVTPVLFTPFEIDKPLAGIDFKIEKLATQSIDPTSLHYYWYFDWDGSNPMLDIFAVCQSKPTCTIFVCDHAYNKRADHTVLAVVSSAAQLDGAVTPTDFPPNTVYDAVEWRIDNKGSCP